MFWAFWETGVPLSCVLEGPGYIIFRLSGSHLLGLWVEALNVYVGGWGT